MAEQPSPSAAPAPAAAEQSDAERLDALDRMLTRLALADDARLAPVLLRVLPYAITSLASPAPAVRKLVSAPDRASSSSPSRLPDLNFSVCRGGRSPSSVRLVCSFLRDVTYCSRGDEISVSAVGLRVACYLILPAANLPLVFYVQNWVYYGLARVAYPQLPLPVYTVRTPMVVFYTDLSNILHLRSA